MRENEMQLQILGTGCTKCKTLADLSEKAANNLGLRFEMAKITEITEITMMGVMATPALAVDGKVLFQGKLPSQAEIEEHLSKVAS
jgi:small redox-active disulfide protein 2